MLVIFFLGAVKCMIGAIQPHHVWDWIGTYLISFPLNGSATVDHLIVVSKTFTENWDSERHLLELSWPI